MAKEKEIPMDIVTLEMDDGKTVDCDVLSIFTVNMKDGPKDYIALIDSTAGDDGEIWFYGCKLNPEDTDDFELIDIEDDDEFEAVCDAFDELLDEEEAEDIFGKLTEDEDDQ